MKTLILALLLIYGCGGPLIVKPHESRHGDPPSSEQSQGWDGGYNNDGTPDTNDVPDSKDDGGDNYDQNRN